MVITVEPSIFTSTIKVFSNNIRLVIVVALYFISVAKFLSDNSEFRSHFQTTLIAMAFDLVEYPRTIRRAMIKWARCTITKTTKSFLSITKCRQRVRTIQCRGVTMYISVVPQIATAVIRDLRKATWTIATKTKAWPNLCKHLLSISKASWTCRIANSSTLIPDQQLSKAATTLC